MSHFFILGYSHRTDSCHNKANTLVCHLLVFYILQKLLSFNKQFLKGEMLRMQLFQPLKFQKISIFFIIKIIHCGIFDTWLIFPFPPNFPWFFLKCLIQPLHLKWLLTFGCVVWKIMYLNDRRLQIISSALCESLIAC